MSPKLLFSSRYFFPLLLWQTLHSFAFYYIKPSSLIFQDPRKPLSKRTGNFRGTQPFYFSCLKSYNRTHNFPHFSVFRLYTFQLLAHLLTHCICSTFRSISISRYNLTLQGLITGWRLLEEKKIQLTHPL